jgi:FtsP/CotA-like multicopper oxidase with cupredoxin domain
MNQALSEAENQYIQRFDTPTIRDFDFPAESGNQPMPYQQIEPAAPPEETAATHEEPAAAPIMSEKPGPQPEPVGEPALKEPQTAAPEEEQKPVLPAEPAGLPVPSSHAAEQTQHLKPECIPKFVDELTTPPVYSPVRCGDEEYLYVIDISQFTQQMLPEGFPETTVWGYGGTVMDEQTRQHRYFRGAPGATFEAVRTMPVGIKWVNKLSSAHLADGRCNGLHTAAGTVPVVLHLHGSNMPPEYNGPSGAWQTYNGMTGPAFKTSCYTYANNQNASALWYRDNAAGIGRQNVYAGLAGFYLLRSGEEFGWRKEGNLPRGRYELSLLLQDRSFNTDGSLSFTGIGTYSNIGTDWASGFYGDTITVNGKTWPNLTVERRQYRFRLLNASPARVYNLRLSNALQLTQIGGSNGFLSEPVVLDTLLLAPDERADILIDFSRIPPGTKIILLNDAKAPFPNGAAPDPETTGQILQFTVPANPPPPVRPKKLPNMLCP